jgi:phosphohistidine swiveling domain-containing protein
LTIKLSTKARTLETISKKFSKKINIPDFLIFNKKYINEKEDELIYKIKKYFRYKKLIIRSSALDEDGINITNAGKYDSFIIKKNTVNNIRKGIKLVCKKLNSEYDEVIFQELLFKPDISGVIFTRDINTNAPYYVLNYDTSKKTNLITSGKKNLSQKTLNILKKLTIVPKKFKKLLHAVVFLEKTFKEDRLDIEFAIKKNKVFIFQVRRLKKNRNVNDSLFYSAITNIHKKITKILKKNPTLSGNVNMLSNMADWNPAEMIGSKSTPMSISLYSELITNDIWSIQRKNYGYKDVSPNRLMVDLMGLPYIDLRTDFNSFLPSNLNKRIETIVINNFIKRIGREKNFHDKIEFKIVPTCLEFTKSDKLSFLNIPDKKNYIKKIKKITFNIISDKNNLFSNDIKKINNLEFELHKLKKFNNPINKIFFLINLCKKSGTLPFAGIARCAFIATKIIRDLLSLNLLTVNEYENFYRSINTITNIFNKDLLKLNNKIITKKNFLKKYGHLRPEMYSICSKNYKNGFKKYFPSLKLTKTKNNTLKISKSKIEILNKFFKKKINLNFFQFLSFAKKSIQERERAKFIFSKCIDEIFNSIEKLSKELKINLNDFDHVSINSLLNSYNNLGVSKLRKQLKKEINHNIKMSQVTSMIKLPEVITSYKDVYINYDTLNNGNFITQNEVTAQIFKLTKKKISSKKINLNNKIVFIENADPGFDFIFSHNIVGLVTKYGGSNSHMAIRCMELNLPAVIGIGEKRYNFLSSLGKVKIDCKKKIISEL